MGDILEKYMDSVDEANEVFEGALRALILEAAGDPELTDTFFLELIQHVNFCVL